MSGDVDDLFFDAARSELFASCGEGFIDIFRFTPPANLARIQRLASAAGARTAFFSPRLGMFCLGVPHRGTQGAEIRIYQAAVAQ